METTVNLALPYIMPAQAQKHVTHNEALRVLDALVQLSARDRNRPVPPATPVEGDRHIVGPAATGLWEGRDGQVAAWQDGAWVYFQPSEGWRIWVAGDQTLLVFHAGQWEPLNGATQNLDMIGVNVAADAVNRLAVASEAVLLSHDGEGHQLKINKAAPGDTASLLFQTNFSGRAEMGTAGDDNFHFKVSGDGASWHEAMVIERGTGAVSFPNTALVAGREILAADRTYHVRIDGDDGNDGLTDSAAGAFATIQKAIDTAMTLDWSIHDVTIRIGGGTYAEAVVVDGTPVGSGMLVLRGNEMMPANVVVNSPGVGITVTNGARLRVEHFEIVSSNRGLWAQSGATVYVGSGMRFGGAITAHIHAQNAYVEIVGVSYSITGNCPRHFLAELQGCIHCAQSTIELVGTRNFGTAFGAVQSMALLRVNSGNVTFTGSATGIRYAATSMSLITTSGGGANFFPGSSAGSATDGAIYM